MGLGAWVGGGVDGEGVWWVRLGGGEGARVPGERLEKSARSVSRV